MSPLQSVPFANLFQYAENKPNKASDDKDAKQSEGHIYEFLRLRWLTHFGA